MTRQIWNDRAAQQAIAEWKDDGKPTDLEHRLDREADVLPDERESPRCTCATPLPVGGDLHDPWCALAGWNR